MEILNIFVAWLCFLYIFVLSIIYPLRKYIGKNKLDEKHIFVRINHFLRKIHKVFGVLAIPLVFLHCRLSSQKLGFNFGTSLLTLLILLLFTFIFRKKLKGKWMNWHRTLTLLFWVLLLIHILFDTERISLFSSKLID